MTPEFPRAEDRLLPDDQIIKGIIAKRDTKLRAMRETWLFQGRERTIGQAVKEIVCKELDNIKAAKPNIPRELRPLAKPIDLKERTPLLKTAQGGRKERLRLETLERIIETTDHDFRPSKTLVDQLKANARLGPEAIRARTRLTNAALPLIVNWVDYLFPSAKKDFRLEAIQQAYAAVLNSWDAIPRRNRSHDLYLSCAIISSLYLWWKTGQREGTNVPKMNPQVKETLPPLVKRRRGQTILEEVFPAGLRPKTQETIGEETRKARPPLPLDRLSPQELLVVDMLLGLTGKKLSPKEIAGALGVSRGAIWLTKEEALRKIRRDLKTSKDGDYTPPEKPENPTREFPLTSHWQRETTPAPGPKESPPPPLPQLVRQIKEGGLPQELAPYVIPVEKEGLPYLFPKNGEMESLYCSGALRELVRIAWERGVFFVIVGGAVRNLLQGKWRSCDLDIQAHSLNPEIPLSDTRAFLARLSLPRSTEKISRHVEGRYIIKGSPPLQLAILPHPDTLNDPWPWIRLSPSCQNFTVLTESTFAELVVIGEEWKHDFSQWASRQPRENSAGIVLIPNGDQIEAFLIDFFGARSALSEKESMRFNGSPVTIKEDVSSTLKATAHLLWLQKTAQQLEKELPEETLESAKEIAEAAKKLEISTEDKIPFADFMTKICWTLTKMFALDFLRLREELQQKAASEEPFETPRGPRLLTRLPTLKFLLDPHGRSLFPRFAKLLESEVAPGVFALDLLLLTSLDLRRDFPELQPQKLSETLKTPPTPDDLPVVAGLKEPWLFFPSLLLWLENIATVKTLKEISENPQPIREFVEKIPKKDLLRPQEWDSPSRRILYFEADFEKPRRKTPRRLNVPSIRSPYTAANALSYYVKEGILASAFSPIEVKQPGLQSPEAPFIVRRVDKG